MWQRGSAGSCAVLCSLSPERAANGLCLCSQAASRGAPHRQQELMALVLQLTAAASRAIRRCHVKTCIMSAKASGSRPGLPKTCNKLIVWNVCFWTTVTSSQRKVGDVAPIISSFVLSPRLALATAPEPDAFHVTRTGNISSVHREWQSLHLASAAAVLHGAERGLLGW